MSESDRTELASRDELKRRITRLRLLPRLARSVRKRYVRAVHGDDFFVTNYFGAKFLVRWGDFVPREISLKNFEQIQLQHCIDTIDRMKPDVFLDVGAHIGLYTCVLLKQTTIPRAILFEPNAPTAAHLRANLLLNGLLNRVEVHECAVSNKAGQMSLETGPDSNSGQAHLAANGTGRQVRVVAIDDVVDLSGKTLAIKMDVERHEIEALAGMERLLTRNRGFVQIETLDTRAQVIELMKGYGYSMTLDFYWDLFFEKL